jgi:hypothetical protein
MIDLKCNKYVLNQSVKSHDGAVPVFSPPFYPQAG